MELKKVDPRLLKEDPLNPRRSPAAPAYEDQLLANIQAVGLIQLPLCKEREGEFFIVAGHRRVQACIRAGFSEIEALFTDSDTRTNAMRSVAENVVRTGLNTVDTWRAIVTLTGADWTEDAIATALNLPTRTIQRLRQCGKMHPAMLEQMALNDEPNARELRLIASASIEDQAEVWKKHKPKRGEHAQWYAIAQALDNRRYYARDAKFGPELAKAHGIVWLEDLFDQGEQDNRYTTQAEEFLGAQYEHMANTLPKKGIILTVDKQGTPQLPHKKAERIYHGAKKSDLTGSYINESTGKIEVITYRMPVEVKPAKPAAGTAGTTTGATATAAAVVAPIVEPAPSRAPITQAGMAMIGDMRTDALHEGLANDAIDDLTLIGLLVIAFCGNNVDVKTGTSDEKLRTKGRPAIARSIAAGGTLTADPETLRQAARDCLRFGLNLRDSYSAKTGPLALVAATAINADRHLPNMATEEFLSCLSKAEIENVGRQHKIQPRNTGKETRGAILKELAGQHYVHPAANFTVTPEDAKAIDAPRHYESYGQTDDDSIESVEGEGDDNAGILRSIGHTGQDPEPGAEDAEQDSVAA